MAFTVRLSDGSLVEYADSATYTFEPHGVLAVSARIEPREYPRAHRFFAPMHWREVVADPNHQPGRHRDRDKWMGGIGTTVLTSYKEADDPEAVLSHRLSTRV